MSQLESFCLLCSLAFVESETESKDAWVCSLMATISAIDANKFVAIWYVNNVFLVSWSWTLHIYK